MSQQQQSHGQDIQPIKTDGDLVANVVAQNGGGKRQQGSKHEKENGNPVQVSIRPVDKMKLGSMTRPEDAKGDKTEKEGKEVREQCSERGQKLLICLYDMVNGIFEIENQEGHGNGEHPVAQGFDPAYLLSGNPVIKTFHHGPLITGYFIIPLISRSVYRL